MVIWNNCSQVRVPTRRGLLYVNVTYCHDRVSYVEDARVYAYVRFETGDEMSRRAKFAFITWIGPGVTPLKKAAVSTDKAFVKANWPVSELIVCL